MLAGGGESCADIEHLRLQPDLFGSVPSDSTVFRTFHELDEKTRAGIAVAMAEMRAKVWSRSSATTGGGPVVLDIDASLVEVHTDTKENAGPTYKGGFGFHPMFCFADATGEVLAGLLRPGNAGANTVADHLIVLDEAIAQLPAADRSSVTGLVTTRRWPTERSWSGPTRRGAPRDSSPACRERNVSFFVTARSNPQVTAAICDAIGIDQVWEPALTQARGTTRWGRRCVSSPR